MIDKKYRHKKTGLIVEWGIGSERYISITATSSYYLPKGVVEDSTEWEEVIPIFDFFGVEIKYGDIHYHLIEDNIGDTHIMNATNYTANKGKRIATFRDFEQGVVFQRLYIALRRSKDLICTAANNPTQYLKDILKTL